MSQRSVRGVRPVFGGGGATPLRKGAGGGGGVFVEGRPGRGTVFEM